MGFRSKVTPFDIYDIRSGSTQGQVRVLGGHPRYCILHSASRGLSAIDEFLVSIYTSAVTPEYLLGADVDTVTYILDIGPALTKWLDVPGRAAAVSM